MKKQLIVVLSLSYIASILFIGAYSYFSDYQSKTLTAFSGVSLSFVSDERVTDLQITPVNEKDTLLKSPDEQTWWCKSGTLVSISAQLKEGYRFTGWFHGDSLKSDSMICELVIDSYTPLTAGLELIEYLVNYETNGGILEDENSFYTVERHFTLPIPVKEGFTFDGWYGSEDYSGSPIISTDGQIGNQTFYAKWTEDTSIKTAFAIYSADDQSLTFYKRSTVPSVNEIYNGKTITAIYPDIESLNITAIADVPWRSDYKDQILSVSVEDVITPMNTAYWFRNLRYCTNFSLENLDTSNVTNMTEMFYGAGEDAATFCVEMDTWNTSNVTSMDSMFYLAGQMAKTWDAGDMKTKVVTKEDGSSYIAWDVSKVENMWRMFSCIAEYAEDFTFDISNWNVSSLVYVHQMFSMMRAYNTNAYVELDVSTKEVLLEDGTAYTAWDFSNYSGSMYYMFGFIGTDAKSVTLNLSGWDVSNVNNMKWMFSGAAEDSSYFKIIGDLPNWNTSNVTNMDAMFKNVGLNADYSLDLSGWDVSNVTAYGSFSFPYNGKIIPPAF